MNAEVRNIFNQDVLDSHYAEAINGWKAKHPNATPEELELIRADLRANILTSRTKNKFLNSKANRQARKAHIGEIAALHGIEFTSVKEVVQSKYKLEELPVATSLIQELLTEMFIEEVPKFVERTVTFAFKRVKVGRAVRLEYAISFQNPGDSADSLVAKEYAISRMIAGQTLIINALGGEIPSYADLAHELVNTGALEVYSESYL